MRCGMPSFKKTGEVIKNSLWQWVWTRLGLRLIEQLPSSLFKMYWQERSSRHFSIFVFMNWMCPVQDPIFPTWVRRRNLFPPHVHFQQEITKQHEAWQYSLSTFCRISGYFLNRTVDQVPIPFKEFPLVCKAITTVSKRQKGKKQAAWNNLSSADQTCGTKISSYLEN